MNIDEAFPKTSSHFKASDLDTPIRVTIKGYEMVDLGDKDKNGNPIPKPILSFSDHEKTLVLNKTNSWLIHDIAGTDVLEQWSGTVIELYRVRTEFKGDMVPAIRVRAPTAPAPPSVGATQPDDDIPF